MPPKIEYESRYKKSTTITASFNYRIACSVVGSPRPDVHCYKNDLKITKDDKVILDNYTIKASNEHGKDNAVFEVQVVDVPEKPRGPMDITLEAEQARYAVLEWKAPRWDGGSELIGYTIEFAKNLEPVYSQSELFIIKINQNKINHYFKTPSFRFHVLQSWYSPSIIHSIQAQRPHP